MNTRSIRRHLGIYGSLFTLFMALGSATLGPLFVGMTTASAASGLSSSGTWQPEATTQCSKPGSKDSVTASLAYSNNEVNNGNPITFQCFSINTAPSGNQQMLLVAASDPTLLADQCIITVGENPTGTYQTNTFANLTCNSPGPNDPGFLLTNTYNSAAGNGNQIAGSATWTGENPGQLTAGTITVNGYRENSEVFDQTSISGNVMTLTGTKNADPTNCGGNAYLDQITVGDAGTSYLDATSGTVTVSQYEFNPSGEHGHTGMCVNTAATISLDDSYSHVCNANGVDCTNSGSTTSNGSSDSCAPGNLLAWVLCPISALLDNAVTALNGVIGTLLYIPTSEIWPPSPQVSPFQHSFDAFRNAAIALLVIAGLIMVISQASDLEIFSAHTVRKALPRIVVAAIGIALAWPLLQLTVTFFNDMGDWIGRIILFSVGDYTPSLGSVVGEITGVIGGAVLALIGVGYMIFALGLGGSGLLALSVLLIFLIGFLVLALRQVVVILCVMLAPLAIASYVLPGTEKLWKFWKDTFLTTLMMYPIIIAFLAAGAAMAHVALSVKGNPFMGILALLLYIVPYLMIPFAFKLAGGIMASAIAMVEGTHRKSIEGRLGKKRQEIAAGNWNAFKQGERFLGSNNLEKRLNAGGAGYGAFLSSRDKKGFLTNQDVRKKAISRYDQMLAARHAKEEGTAATQYDDDMLHAQRALSEGEARTRLTRRWEAWSRTDDQGNTLTNEQARERLQGRVNTAIGAARAQGGFGRTQRAYAVQQLAATGTGYDNMEDMLTAVAEASDGNVASMDAFVGNMRSAAERSGRAPDLKGDHGDMVRLATAISRDGGVTQATREGIQDQVVSAARAVDNVSLERAKKKSVGNAATALTGALGRQLDIVNGRRPGDQQKAAEAAAELRTKLENMIATASQGYAPESNIAQMQEVLHRASATTPSTAYNPVTPSVGSLNNEVQWFINPSGGVIRGPNGQVIGNLPNPRYNEAAGRKAAEQKVQRYRDPNDPNSPLQQP